VTAVLAVRLREHHQFDVGRIAAQRAVRVAQVADLVRRQRETQRLVRALENGATARRQRDARERARGRVLEQLRGFADVIQDRFGHAIVDRAPQRRLVEHLADDDVKDAAFDAPHPRQAAAVRDVGRLRRPRGHGAEARNHQHAPAERDRGAPDAVGRPRSVAQQALEDLGLLLGRLAVEVDESDRTRRSGRGCRDSRAGSGSASSAAEPP
jgi:hypothetical protein